MVATTAGDHSGTTLSRGRTQTVEIAEGCREQHSATRGAVAVDLKVENNYHCLLMLPYDITSNNEEHPRPTTTSVRIVHTRSGG